MCWNRTNLIYKICDTLGGVTVCCECRCCKHKEEENRTELILQGSPLMCAMIGGEGLLAFRTCIVVWQYEGMKRRAQDRWAGTLWIMCRHLWPVRYYNYSIRNHNYYYWYQIQVNVNCFGTREKQTAENSQILPEFGTNSNNCPII